MLEAQRQGESVDVQSYAAGNEALVDELRQIWAACQLADAIGSGALGELDADATSSGVRDTSTSPLADFELPHQFGDYELLEELGRGGMGVVFRARQQSLDRIVALKMILRGNLASQEDRLRFRSEAEAAARLKSPHIVPIYEVDDYQGQAYFTMAHIEGETLAQRLQKGPLPPQEAARILRDVARAVGVAHAEGVLHRDLKPSNILLDGQGRPHVSDFGLAKRVATGGETVDQSLTRTGAILGTPSYMAPEQAAGNRGELGPATDIYSLGALLYQMLTGRPPFQAATALDTIMLVLEQDPVPPRVLNPRADHELELIALRCLQKPPDLRYENADRLAEDLEAYLAGEPISARSGRISAVMARMFRDTHHVDVLENWGLLWMWHALALLVLCLVTNLMHSTNLFQAGGVQEPIAYVGLWGGGLAVWAPIFWLLRHRAGPVTFVERQIAHVWAGSVVASVGLFAVEWILALPVLTLSPVLGLINGVVFTVKAGILTGEFYVQAAALFLTAAVMAILQVNGIDVGVSLFGIVSAAAFFFPGLKYYRRTHESTG
ncbi:MAG: serine/threonine protein kinase [Planctomycetota bacterium]|nr:MAG: serine/threonine protein kinase [Planctomycetota bacterium]REJ93725.1 MAG: serine/threonine protein kinase [Planctomycetota bacterium]REK25775.1 MAG: serine/threonine protein kinase [Planctomycetota bacterium]REK46639.1 MAG: serine/threonine protein kinase [Planctomycetota bacterium]